MSACSRGASGPKLASGRAFQSQAQQDGPQGLIGFPSSRERTIQKYKSGHRRQALGWREEFEVLASCVRNLSLQVTRTHDNSNNNDPAGTSLCTGPLRYTCSQRSAHTVSFDLCKALGGAAVVVLT